MKKKSVMSQLFAFTNGCRGKTAFSIILAVSGVLCGMAPYFALAGILTEMIQNILTVQHIFYYVGIAILGETLKMVLSTLSSLEAHKITYHILENIRCKLAEKMMRVPMGVMVDTPSGKLKAMVVDTVEKLEQPLAHMLPEITANVFTPICIIIVLFALDWRMALACMLVIPVGLITLAGLAIGMILLNVIQNGAEKAMPMRFHAQEEMTERTLEFVQGNMVMRLFGTGQDGLNRVKEAFQKKQKADIHLENSAIWPINFYKYVFRLASCGVVLIAALLYAQQEMSFPICVMFLFAAFLVYSQMDGLASNIALLRIVDNSLEQVESVLHIPKMPGNEAVNKIQNYDIELQNISFGYDKRPIIQDVSLKIPERSVTAIVGPSGSGKTTLCNLIARFWDVQKGAILIGGKNVKDIEPDELMKLMSIVFQNVYLFHDTIENNIKFGRPDATHEAVVEAARRACCHDFIEKLPNAYQTVIGEGGSTLSGGEKQRISIARAILKDAPIVILDEATSSVDPENQHILLTAINELTKGKTLIIIAHRLSTIRNADQIVVLDGGRIVQQGTHKTLIQQDGVYRRFVQIRKTTFSWKL